MLLYRYQLNRMVQLSYLSLVGLFCVVIADQDTAPVQAPNFGFLPCSLCGSNETLLQIDAVIPANTVSFVAESMSCLEIELMAEAASFSLIQCGELFASNVSEICGCSATSGTAPSVAAPTSSTIVSTGRPTTLNIGLTPTSSPISNLVPLAVPSPNSLTTVGGEVMITLQSVPEKMIDVVTDAYLEVMTSFYSEFLITTDFGSVVNVSVGLMEQNLKKDSSQVGRLLQTDNGTSSPTLYPLDTLLKVSGLATVNSIPVGESLNNILVQVTNENAPLLANNLRETVDLAQLFFSNVTTVSATDPTTLLPPVGTPSVPTALAPQTVPTTATAPVVPKIDNDRLSKGATIAVMMAVFGLLVLALLLGMGMQKKKPSNPSSSEQPLDQNNVVIDKHTDPFAPREGKALVWKNVNMTLAGTKDEPTRELLKDVWGEVPSKETTAIMG
jgi:hypothetical protein